MMLLCTELVARKAAIEARLLAANPIHQRKKENTYRKPPTTSMHRNTGKRKALAKKRTYTKSNKPG